MRLILLFILWVILSKAQQEIHIGVSIDLRSIKDALIMMHSIEQSALSPKHVHFHVVACGKDLADAEITKNAFIEASSCLGFTSIEIKPFSLPIDSGFYKQLHSKRELT